MNNDTKLMVVTKPIVTLYSEDGKETFTISSYMGGVRICIFSATKEDKRPIAQVTLPSQTVYLWVKQLKSLIPSMPNSKKDIHLQSWNQTNKTYQPELSIVAIKDNKMCYSLELSNARLSPPIAFPFKCRKDVVIGNEAMSEETKSQAIFEWFIYKLEHQVEIERMLTGCTLKEQPDFNKKNSSSGYSSNTSSSDSFYD